MSALPSPRAAHRPAEPWTRAAVLALVLGLALAGGCARAGSGTHAGQDGGTAPIAGGTLVYGRGHDSVRLDPGHETDGESFKVMDSLYENLVAFADTTTDLVPELATRWEISPDGLRYTFHLRRGVKFHDGTPLDAAAVVFSFDRQRDMQPPNPYHGVGGPYTYWQSLSMDDIVQDVSAADDSTVVITLKRRNAPFLANLAMGFAAIVSPTAVRKYGEDFARQPVGTGPFRFVEWVKDDHITLERNPGYWGARPHLDGVIFRSIPENTVRFLALEEGSIQGLDGLNTELAQRVAAAGKFRLVTQPGMNVGYLAMNEDKPPFDRREVRLAFNYAIQKDAIVKGLYGGFGAPARNPLPPTMWGYNAAVPDYPYDPAKAKQLLARAGFPHGFQTELWAMNGPRPYMPDPLKIAEAIQADLARVGVTAEIRTFEWGTYLDQVQHGRHATALMGWTGDNGDPDNFLYVLLDKESTRLPSQNIAFYRGEAVHELLVAAQQETDRAKRESLYVRAQAIVHDDAPWVPLAHMTQLAAFNRRVHGFLMNPTGKLRFKGVWITPGA